MDHQGEALQMVLGRLGINITELSRRIDMSRTAIYNWFTMPIIPPHHLESVGKSLGIDIYRELQDVMKSKNVKFYRPSRRDDPQAEEERTFINQRGVAVTLNVDGTEDTLETCIRKLRAISEAIASI